MQHYRSLLTFAACFLAVYRIAPVLSQEMGHSELHKILVFAAASSTNAMLDIKRQFRQETGIEVQTSFGSSSTLTQQIVHGADADVCLSADVAWAEYLAKEGYVVRRRNLLGNRLVIIVPDDSKLQITRPADLLSPQVEHLALGNPDSAPAGKYAKQVLVKLGLWEALKPKVAAAQDVRRALAFVETGAAEAGIVYATDAAITKRVKVVADIPPELTGKVCYPVVLLKHGENSAAALAFYHYLCSPPALAVFRKYGFTILPAAGGKNDSGGPQP